VQERHAAEHGTPYTLSTSAASRHDMAAWLRANGKPITLWSDVQAEWMSNNGHRIVLDQDTWDQLHAMRAAVMAHPAASALLSMRGVAEHSVYWIDQQTGMLLRCRPDWWIKERGIVVDVKTTDDASPEGFAKSIANWRYHVQHPFYIDGINEARRQIIQANEGLEFPEAVHPEVTTFVFLAVEKKSPHAVGVYMLDSLSVELGRALYRRDLETLAKCRATDTWPGYGDAIQSITVPAWEFKAHEGLLGAA
jgi:exodeoxyribonuclease VIII